MRAQRGFTLIELIIAISLIGILAAYATPAFIETIRAYAGAVNNTRTVDALRTASERLAREIREADRSSFVQTASSVRFTRTEYFASGSSTTEPPVTATITVSQEPLTKLVKLEYNMPNTGSTNNFDVTGVLTNQASALLFAFYGSDGITQISSPSATSPPRFVEFTLTLTEPSSGKAISQRTRVALRNGG